MKNDIVGRLALELFSAGDETGRKGGELLRQGELLDALLTDKSEGVWANAARNIGLHQSPDAETRSEVVKLLRQHFDSIRRTGR